MAKPGHMIELGHMLGCFYACCGGGPMGRDPPQMMSQFLATQTVKVSGVVWLHESGVKIDRCARLFRLGPLL